MRTDDKDQARVIALVRRAAKAVGGQNQLAREMGYGPTEVSEWANGKRACPAKAQAVMAHLAGLEAVEVLVAATIAQEANPQRKAALLTALGKQFAHLGAAAFCASSAVLGWASLTTLVDTMRIM